VPRDSKETVAQPENATRALYSRTTHKGVIRRENKGASAAHMGGVCPSPTHQRLGA
jgi:hypothetical protein